VRQRRRAALRVDRPNARRGLYPQLLVLGHLLAVLLDALRNLHPLFGFLGSPFLFREETMMEYVGTRTTQTDPK